MTKSQQLEIKLSESRSGIQALLDLPSEKREATYEASLRKATDEHRLLETEFRAALSTEQAVETTRVEATRPLAKQAELRNWIAASLGIRKLEGAERELSQEIGLAHNQVPTALVAEHRADAIATSGAAATQTNQEPTQARVFPQMVSSRLGVEMPSVPVGKESYPILTDGVSGSTAAAGAAVDAEAVTFSTKSLSPVRISARYLFNQEDILVMPDFEQTLRNDLSTALAIQIDALNLTGDGSAPNPAGFFTASSGLVQPSSTPVQADGKAYFTSTLASLAGEIDGLYAHGLGDLNLLVGHETASFLVQSFRTDENDQSIYDYLMSRLGSQFSSDQVPAPATNNQRALIYKSGAMVRSAVCPIWQASTLIVDPYSKSASGQTSLTLHSFFNFAVLRPQAYKVLSFRVKYGAN